MCGICGIVQGRGLLDGKAVESMRDAMLHRGPDDGGLWMDRQSGVALAHRRLSILDLSPEGHQPMLSRSQNGRFVIVFNGEIYNFLGLRKELQGKRYEFRGGSDTEVMLAAFEEWGIKGALERFVGMFAFAVWDQKERTLTLARDRIGEKPLYYGWNNDAFFFASELKAIQAHPLVRSEINRDALALFMRHNYIPAPWSIYKGIYKLWPGSFLELSYSMLTGGGNNFSPWPESDDAVHPQRYWSAREICEEATREPFVGSDSDAIEGLDSLMREAVRWQMVADVPLGAFLSGGVDSSAIVALMQAQSSVPIRTFSIGFYEGEYNEAHHAKEVAKHLGTAHTELYATPKDAIDVIPLLPSLYDEPFSDSSQIPTCLVSRLARSHVTVSLSGDGGDELLGGYQRFLWANKIWKSIGWMPAAMRKLSAFFLHVPKETHWDRLFYLLTGPDGGSLFRRAGHKVYRLAEVLDAKDRGDLYQKLLSHWENPTRVVRDSLEPQVVMTDRRQWPKGLGYIRTMMFLDLMSYLPDDIMVKVDRASMGVSLESRAPFLDHRVVEYIWKLPIHMKIRKGETKWVLRQLLYKYVPKELIDRPKMGFGVPIDSWLRGSLRDWAEDLLSEKRLKEEGFFDPVAIRQKWTGHLSEKSNYAYYLWDVLMFQSWLASQKR